MTDESIFDAIKRGQGQLTQHRLGAAESEKWRVQYRRKDGGFVYWADNEANAREFAASRARLGYPAVVEVKQGDVWIEAPATTRASG